MPSITELQPYLAAIGAFLGVATLGFVMRISVFARDAEKQRFAITNERLAMAKEFAALTEKLNEQKTEVLTTENESLRSQLEEVLSDSGMTMQALASGKSLEKAQESMKLAVDKLLSQMENAEQSNGVIGHPAWHLEFAKGYMAKSDWSNAALHFDKFVAFSPTDSDTQFSRGVAHANTGADTLSALRAYNEAIAYAPENLDFNMRARYFTYRAAILKRMGRLNEAESDLKLAQPLASGSYEVNDIKYNFAAVYAMMGRRSDMMTYVRDLHGHPRELGAIRYHLKDYFVEFANDGELLAIVSPDTTV